MSDIPKTVEEIMSKPVKTVTQEATVREVIKTLRSNRIGSVVVAKNNEPVGIITERDIIMKYVDVGLPSELKASNVMSAPLITCASDTSILRAFIIMHENRVRRLPVVNGGKLVGIVTERDLIGWMMRFLHYPESKSAFK